jgi:hypothetical protein
MIPGLIFGISFLTLLQFFVIYCRSLIAASRTHALSEQAREICGISARPAGGDQFQRLVQLIALCPESGGDAFEVRAVAAYFRMLGWARTLCGWAIPSAATWIESERGGCVYAAAVVLDRRIAFSRTMMANLASH